MFWVQDFSGAHQGAVCPECKHEYVYRFRYTYYAVIDGAP